MAQYAIFDDKGTVVNVIEIDNDMRAALFNALPLASGASIGWTATLTTDPDTNVVSVTNWQAPAPKAPTPQDTAQTNLSQMLAQQAPFADQINNDVILFQSLQPAADGSVTLQAEHVAAFVRMVQGFATTMQAHVDTLTYLGLNQGA